MAIEIVVPRLGWSMEEGTFGEWLKKDGDFVEQGEAVFVLEGEKSAQDIEAVDSGILRLPPNAPQSGDTVLVGQVIAYFLAPGESLPEQNTTTKQNATAGAAKKAETGSGIDFSSEKGSAIVVADQTIQSRDGTGRIPVSPRARRAAERMGVDLTAVSPSGSTGRIRERDVLDAANSRAKTQSPRTMVGENKTTIVAADYDSKLRRTIAARMSEATQTTAPVTIHRRCDASNLVNLRSQFRAAGVQRETPSFTDLIVKLTGCVLADNPQLRVQWGEREFTLPEGIHIAVAVDTPQGLYAPVVRDVDQIPLRQINTQIKELADRCRDGRLREGDFAGGCFTITNLGSLGVEYFTPIINLPQSAILGVGKISREPIVRDEQIIIRDQLALSLTFDHRLIDGAPAARFLESLCSAIENPGPWLMN